MFAGATKPWLISFDEAGNAQIGDTEKHSHDHLKLWWQIFNNNVRPQLNKSLVMTGSSEEQGSLACLETVTSAAYMDTPPAPAPAPPPSDNR